MKVIIPLADGVEEMEAVILIDVFRRAGWKVTAAAVSPDSILTASRGVKLVADCLWTQIEDINAFDLIAIPGGMGGTKLLCSCPDVLAAIRHFDRQGKTIAAICAGPLVLQAAGILKNKRYTCYPGIEKDIPEGTYEKENTVIDDHLMTSRGPGTAFEFALEMIAAFEGKAAAETVQRQLLLT